MPMEMKDTTGQPRSEEDLKEALDVVESTMLKDMLKIPPELATHLMIIRYALREAIVFRKLSQREQIGWYNPGTKRFCRMIVKEGATVHYAAYTEPVWVFNKS